MISGFSLRCNVVVWNRYFCLFNNMIRGHTVKLNLFEAYGGFKAIFLSCAAPLLSHCDYQIKLKIFFENLCVPNPNLMAEDYHPVLPNIIVASVSNTSLPSGLYINKCKESHRCEAPYRLQQCCREAAS